MSFNNPNGTPFLSNSSFEMQELFYKFGKKKSYSANTILLRPNDSVNAIYYIDKGRVRMYTGNLEGKEKILIIMDEGFIFGGAPSLLSEISTVTVVTETPVVLFKVDRNIISDTELFKDGLIKYLSGTVLTLMKNIESLSLESCKTRLYNLFCALADKDTSLDPDWYSLRLQYSQEDLAKIIGVNRVSIARSINELCTEELLKIVNRKILVKIKEQ